MQYIKGLNKGTKCLVCEVSGVLPVEVYVSLAIYECLTPTENDGNIFHRVDV